MEVLNLIAVDFYGELLYSEKIKGEKNVILQ